MPYQIAKHPAYPDHWIARDSLGKLVIFPKATRAWYLRKPYTGPLRGLVRLDSGTADAIAGQVCHGEFGAVTLGED